MRSFQTTQSVATMALQTFSKVFAEQGEYHVSLTALVVDGEPWFRGAEAATSLGYKNPQRAIRAYVDEEDKTTLRA